jgi:acyl carrier protein
VASRGEPDVAAKVNDLINQIVSGSFRFDGDEPFISKTGMNSLQSVHFALRVEETFGIRFGEDKHDFDAFFSFGKLVELIRARVDGAC